MEAAMNYSFDPFEGMSEEECRELCISINEASEDVKRGRYYEMDEVFRELKRRIDDMAQNPCPLSDERLEELKKKFGDPEEMMKGLADAYDELPYHVFRSSRK